MYLHVGGGRSVRKKEIVGIFDLDTATVSRHTKRYMNQMAKEGRVSYTDADLPRSFVLIERDGVASVELSRISPSGLCSRMREGYDLGKDTPEKL